MLGDLVQYFTISAENQAVDNEMTLAYMLQFFYKYTKIEEIRTGIESSVIFNPEVFYELDEVWIDDIYMNDMHLGDCLGLSYENNFVQMVFSTFMNENDFDVDFSDSDLYCFFGCDYGEDDVAIDKFEGFSLDRKINKYVNDFIKREIRVYASEDGKLDRYYLEMERIVFMHITFKNKSLARKLRKAYSKNSIIKAMLENMNIFMMNGEFIALILYNLESGFYGDYIDFEEVYKGIREIRKCLDVGNENVIGHRLDLAFRTLNYELFQERNCSENNHYIFFNRIIKEHCAPEREVIL